MELRVLNYFLMVAREKNITKAARLLHVTQPTLSRQLMGLEEELGVKLFDRSSHSIVLTSEGVLLKRRAQEMLDLAEKTRKELRQNEENLTGQISIGSGEFQSMNELSDIIASFRRRHPLVTFNIFSGNSTGIKSLIESGFLDMGLLLEPSDTSKYESIRLKTRENVGVLVRDDCPLASKESVSPADLANYPLMIPANETMQNKISGWFGDYAKQINVISTHNLVYNSAVMSQNGIGVTVTLNLDCRYSGLKFIPLKDGIELGSVLVWKGNRVFSPVTNAFIEHVKKCLKGIK